MRDPSLGDVRFLKRDAWNLVVGLAFSRTAHIPRVPGHTVAMRVGTIAFD